MPEWQSSWIKPSSVDEWFRTIFPDAKTRAVVLGSLMRMITAANLCRGTTLEFSPRLACRNRRSFGGSWIEVVPLDYILSSLHEALSASNPTCNPNWLSLPYSVAVGLFQKRACLYQFQACCCWDRHRCLVQPAPCYWKPCSGLL